MTQEGRRARSAGGRPSRYCAGQLPGFFSSFCGSEVDGLLEPAPAEPLVEPEPDIEPEVEPEVEPPLAGESFSCSVADEEEDAAPPEGELGELVAPEGELGDVAEPDAEPEVDPAPGEVAPPWPPPCCSPQAVSMLAPKASETATANVESLICWPPWLG